MLTTIDGAGRIVVPKQLRDRLHLEGGSTVDIDERDGTIEIRPAPVELEIVRTPEGPVARAASPVPTLTDEAVIETLDSVRR